LIKGTSKIDVHAKQLFQITKLTNYIKMNLMRLKNNKKNNCLKLKGLKSKKKV